MDFLSSINWISVFKIVGIDIMLGVDNAIVIALACASLPKENRNKAVVWGTAGAIALRALLLVLAGFIMGIPYVKFVAGAYLIFLGYKLLMSNDGEHNVAAKDRVLAVVWTIIVADFMMSLDNVLAVAGTAESAGEHSTIYAIAGIVLSIPIIVFGATGLIDLMKKFPIIVWLGGGLLGWVGAEMLVTDPLLADHMDTLREVLGEHAHHLLNAIGFVSVIIAVFIGKRIRGEKDSSHSPASAN